MAPHKLIALKNLPLTISGKLDRKSLPAVNFINFENFISPSTILEKKLCQFWSEVLGINQDDISIHDDFFKLGGSSILVVLLVNKINKTYHCDASISTVFQNNTINKLAKYIDARHSDLMVHHGERGNFKYDK